MKSPSVGSAATGDQFRVLHVSMPTEGGAAVVLLGCVEDQIRRGWAVCVACPPDHWLASRTAAIGARVVCWQAERSPGLSIVSETRRLARIVKAERPDLIHLHSAKAGLVGRLVVRGRIPTVFQPHGWSFFAVSGVTRLATLAWERFAGRWTGALVCVSDGERLIGLEHRISSPTTVVPNGVDCQRFVAGSDRGRRAARLRLGIRAVPTAVCVGRLSEQKGQDLLLEAWRTVHHDQPDAQLFVVGDGPDRESLAGMLVEGSGATLVGHSENISDWYAAADVVILPSRWEGMPLAPLEAMASSRSVVATDVAGVAESVPKSAGAIVRPGDIASLAAEVTRRLSDNSQADAEGEVGRRHVERYHSLQHSHDKLATVYARLLATEAKTVN